MKCALIGAVLTVACAADTINIGTLSFDVLIPASGTPGVNAFSIGNLTGPFVLDPDFTVLTPIDLLNVELSLSTSNGSSVIQLGNLASGFHSPPALQFADSQLFLSASLFADLGASVFTLTDGRILNVPSPHIVVDLLPMFDINLAPGLDLLVFSVEATETNSVPEPAPFLTFTTVGAWLIWTRRRRATR